MAINGHEAVTRVLLDGGVHFPVAFPLASFKHV
jgi:hypothetical protein